MPETKASENPDGCKTASGVVNVATKMPADEAERFEKLAEADGCTKYSKLRELIEVYLDVHSDLELPEAE